MDRDEALCLDCDVLLPAAKENVITSTNADCLRCKILCEGANGPTTPVADEILAAKKIFVIPAILCLVGATLLMLGDRTAQIERRLRDAAIQQALEDSSV